MTDAVLRKIAHEMLKDYDGPKLHPGYERARVPHRSPSGSSLDPSATVGAGDQRY